MTQILFIAAAICFGVDAFRVSTPINLVSAGFCLLTVALFLL